MSSSGPSLAEIGIYAPIGLAALVADKVLPIVRDEVTNLRQQVPAARFIGQMATREAELRLRAMIDRKVGPFQGSSSAERSTVETPAPSDAQSLPAQPASSVDELRAPEAIEGYENLSASQILPLLAGLEATELAEVERYERATRQRRTILNRIGQLRDPRG